MAKAIDAVYDSVRELEAIHGHDGQTGILWKEVDDVTDFCWR